MSRPGFHTARRASAASDKRLEEGALPSRPLKRRSDAARDGVAAGRLGDGVAAEAWDGTRPAAVAGNVRVRYVS